jgi:hypothetical protein
MFYQVTMTGPGPKTAHFLSIRDIPIEVQDGSLHIVASLPRDARLRQFEYTYDESVDTIIHIDAVAWKIKLVPHYNKARASVSMCGIRMWPAH